MLSKDYNLAFCGPQEDVNAIREGMRGALADYEQLFRAQEVNRRMKEKAAHACHALCRARVVEEIRLLPPLSHWGHDFGNDSLRFGRVLFGDVVDCAHVVTRTT